MSAIVAAAPFTALDIAKWFINATDRESGDAITHLKVQKLIYYAQGWALGRTGEPLFDEDLEAWAHGPVAMSVYHQFRDCGFDAIPSQKITRRITGEHARLLTRVNNEYGIFSAKRLEKKTHAERPWLEARGSLPPEARCKNVIVKATMRRFFERELSAAAG